MSNVYSIIRCLMLGRESRFIESDMGMFSCSKSIQFVSK